MGERTNERFHFLPRPSPLLLFVDRPCASPALLPRKRKRVVHHLGSCGFRFLLASFFLLALARFPRLNSSVAKRKRKRLLRRLMTTRLGKLLGRSVSVHLVYIIKIRNRFNSIKKLFLFTAVEKQSIFRIFRSLQPSWKRY